VIIITIDGMRPDGLDLADTPTLDRLRAAGAYSPNAQTISLSETLPSHASMLSGMMAAKHGIQFGTPYIGWPGMNAPHSLVKLTTPVSAQAWSLAKTS
jgi:arylsulfatase A-like enzyme